MQRFTTTGFACLLLMGLTSAVNAQAIQARVEFPFEFYDPCNDEIVIADVVGHLLLLPDGSQLSNTNGTAVGLTSGTVYQSNGTASIESEVIEDGNTLTFLTTGTTTLHLISHGANPNLVVTTHLELLTILTFDPVTGFIIDIQNFDNTIEVIDCRGMTD